MTRALSIILTLPLLLTGCATVGGNDCISSDEAMKQLPSFGSEEAGKAYRDVPIFYAGPNQDENARIAVEQTTSALNSFEMPASGAALFVRKRLAANEKLLNVSAARDDIEKLISLGELAPNEAPYLLKKLETLGSMASVNHDRDAQPLIRVPPIMSQAAINGDNSGHCVLTFDVDSIGRPENIEVGYCTKDVFRDSSVESVAKWKYVPAKKNGELVSRKGVETTVRYVIQDSCGNVLPE